MKCNLCHDEWPDAEGGLESVLDHLRVMHPGEEVGDIERWPDGSVVIYDDTLQPEDFA